MIERTDGGRAEAGFKGKPYLEVHNDLKEMAKRERKSKHKKGISCPEKGVHKATIRRYMESLGWHWTPTMQIGQGCKVHLHPDELPAGRLVVSVSRHLVAVIDGVIHDSHDSTRSGKRCVYGYWTQTKKQ
ncbi:hypothetical protein [Geoalkalibacter halelectricus]|uniref:hypothetical protein n=1 Tax=Geoalkalibacter halelectricus TaxID=2847045 RepID=UPI00266E9A82|nr:hypothetical protein [Geoalkalibacter halelectricus]MDO3380430.1 hypothetical protein [Geoalkalibacter halelectricus]